MLPSDGGVYVAMDKGDVHEMAAQVLGAFDEVTQTRGEPINLFALLDTAFDAKSAPFAQRSESEALYCEGRWAPLERASPIVISVRRQPAEHVQREVIRLVRHCNGRPMLSFIATSLATRDLAVHLRQFMAPRIEGMEATLLRFADTRVSTVLPACLSKEHWEALSAPLSRWWVFERHSELRALPVVTDDRQQSERPEGQMRFELAQLELTRLMDAGLPDALVHTMSEQLPDFLPESHKAAFFENMELVARSCKAYGIDAYPDQYALAVLVATNEVSVLHRADVKELLASGDWRDGELASRLVELT